MLAFTWKNKHMHLIKNKGYKLHFSQLIININFLISFLFILPVMYRENPSF